MKFFTQIIFSMKISHQWYIQLCIVLWFNTKYQWAKDMFRDMRWSAASFGNQHSGPQASTASVLTTRAMTIIQSSVTKCSAQMKEGTKNVLTVVVRNGQFCFTSSPSCWLMIYILIYCILISSCPVHWDWCTVESHSSELQLSQSYIFDNHKWPIELKRPATLLLLRMAVSIINGQTMPMQAG